MQHLCLSNYQQLSSSVVFMVTSPVFLLIKRKGQAKAFILEYSNINVQELRCAKSVMHSMHSIVSNYTTFTKSHVQLSYFLCVRLKHWYENSTERKNLGCHPVSCLQIINQWFANCKERVRSEKAHGPVLQAVLRSMPRHVAHRTHTPPFFSQKPETSAHCHSLLSLSDDTASLSAERECAHTSVWAHTSEAMHYVQVHAIPEQWFMVKNGWILHPPASTFVSYHQYS